MRFPRVMVCISLLVILGGIPAYLPTAEAPRLTPQQEIFKDYKLGMFIHFGPYSTPRLEWRKKNFTMPPGEYERRAREFNPQEFDARNWVETARSAGARYITFTSKHHDGFCLFDSKLTDYTSMHTPANRDLVAELAAECHRQKMPLFIYYSPLDSHQPDFARDWPAYLQYWQGQLRELATRYGKIAGSADAGVVGLRLRFVSWLYGTSFAWQSNAGAFIGGLADPTCRPI